MRAHKLVDIYRTIDILAELKSIQPAATGAAYVLKIHLERLQGNAYFSATTQNVHGILRDRGLLQYTYVLRKEKKICTICCFYGFIGRRIKLFTKNAN